MSRPGVIAGCTSAALLLVSPGVVAAMPAAVASNSSCRTSLKRIAKDIRQENRYPLATDTKARDVTACRGKWAVITRPGAGDTSFNTRYIAGHWRYYSGYPMPNCNEVPAWLCPNHP